MVKFLFKRVSPTAAVCVANNWQVFKFRNIFVTPIACPDVTKLPSLVSHCVTPSMGFSIWVSTLVVLSNPIKCMVVWCKTVPILALSTSSSDIDITAIVSPVTNLTVNIFKSFVWFASY